MQNVRKSVMRVYIQFLVFGENRYQTFFFSFKKLILKYMYFNSYIYIILENLERHSKLQFI